jgi:glucose/arabinose dehydrogenase
MAKDVVTGFLDGDNRARGRPVGVIIDKSGALLIADDVGNTCGGSRRRADRPVS